MDVAVSVLRAELSGWIHRVHGGEEVVVTERGVPVARLVPITSSSLLEQLTADGVIGKPISSERPSARATRRVTPRSPVADLIGEQRR